MKAIIGTFVLVMILGVMQIPGSEAPGRADAVKPVGLLRALRQNAADAAENARIYQWKRVNREVDRIAADAHKVSSSPSADVIRHGEALQRAVRDLRSARFHRDADAVVEASRRVISECDALLTP